MPDQKIDWARSHWDYLPDHTVRSIVENLPDDVQQRILKELDLSAEQYRAMGWVEVCGGCGAETEKRDCGCPAGTGWKPPVFKTTAPDTAKRAKENAS